MKTPPYNYSETISDLWPNVDFIEIDYKATYISAFGVFEKKGTMRCKPDSLAYFYVDCPNNDCTCGYFDLYPQVSDAIAAKSFQVSGVLSCKGDESKDHPNRCDTKLEYTIAVEYRKDYGQ